MSECARFNCRRTSVKNGFCLPCFEIMERQDEGAVPAAGASVEPEKSEGTFGRGENPPAPDLIGACYACNAEIQADTDAVMFPGDLWLCEACARLVTTLNNLHDMGLII